MPSHVIDTIASVFTAIGTVAVAILAIWGDQIKDRLLGPRLGLSLVSAKGDLTLRGDGSKVYYYHLRVTNQKGRNAARGTRVVMQAFARRAPSGRFVISPLVYPLQLVWTPFEPGETERLVTDESFCDLGYVGEFEKIFRLAAIATPNNFSGSVEKDACVRYELVAIGQNVLSRKPVVLEVSWDGQWTENQEEMQRHLVIREISVQEGTPSDPEPDPDF